MKASDDTEGKPRHLLVPRFHQARGKKGESKQEEGPKPAEKKILASPKPSVKKEIKAVVVKTPKVIAPG